MSEVVFKDIKLNDIFILKRGKVISKEYIKNFKGQYPVYSTQIDQPLGYITDNMYEGKFLIWNTDGLAGYIRIINGKFSITNIVGIMSFKEEFSHQNISLEYIKYHLEPIFRKNIKGRMGEKGKNEYSKLNSTMIKELDIKLPFPINDEGEIDLETQKVIANKYEKIMAMKELLKEKKNEIEALSISFLEDSDCKAMKITELFTPKLGDGKYTQKYCLQNSGEYPLYSGNTTQKFSLINKYNYEGEYLTWAKDGLAGYLMYHNEKFAITNHRGILIPTDQGQKINLKYIKIILEPIFRRNIKGRLGIEGKNEYTTLSKDMINKLQEKILIPIREDGSFDLEKQVEIASKHERLMEIKEKIVNQLNELLSKEIEI
ncbi:restriction endonuclease subunit S [Metabacillus sp. FJAT-53654]|uniref:Restriction endonuclease subunit S n=1 Tax=Metabacillus rhizosphaerae TaxID=3117747 RepID=A0ABZ2MNT2_9BACI